MVVLFGIMAGFAGAFIPDMLRFLEEWAIRRHELALKGRKSASPSATSLHEHYGIESKALYVSMQPKMGNWVEVLNRSVRPILAYGFFLLYSLVKAAQFSLLLQYPGTASICNDLWGTGDQVLLACIISFYFSQRAMAKLRGR